MHSLVLNSQISLFTCLCSFADGTLASFALADFVANGSPAEEAVSFILTGYNLNYGDTCKSYRILSSVPRFARVSFCVRSLLSLSTDSITIFMKTVLHDRVIAIDTS